MKLVKLLLAGGCVATLFVGGAAEARYKKPLLCAQPDEVTAMQAAAIQQELMDAALTCGDEARDNYNAFQTSFGPELRRSDKALLRLFRRVQGYSKGDAAYNLFKTELAAKAELRRVHGHQDFCTAANLVVAAALNPDKPALEDFVGGVPVTEKPQSPIDFLPNAGRRDPARRPGGGDGGAQTQSVTRSRSGDARAAAAGSRNGARHRAWRDAQPGARQRGGCRACAGTGARGDPAEGRAQEGQAVRLAFRFVELT